MTNKKKELDEAEKLAKKVGFILTSKESTTTRNGRRQYDRVSYKIEKMRRQPDFLVKSKTLRKQMKEAWDKFLYTDIF